MVAGPHLWVYNSIILKFLVWNQKKFFWAYLILSFGQGNPMMVRLMGPIKKTKQLSAETHLSCSPSTSTLLSSFCNILGYSSIRGWHQLGTHSSTIWPLSHPDMHRISKSFLLPVPSEAPACSPQGHQCSCYWGRGTPGWQSFFSFYVFLLFFSTSTAEHWPEQLAPRPQVTLVTVLLGKQQPTSISSRDIVNEVSKKALLGARGSCTWGI